MSTPVWTVLRRGVIVVACAVLVAVSVRSVWVTHTLTTLVILVAATAGLVTFGAGVVRDWRR